MKYDILHNCQEKHSLINTVCLDYSKKKKKNTIIYILSILFDAPGFCVSYSLK